MRTILAAVFSFIGAVANSSARPTVKAPLEIGGITRVGGEDALRNFMFETIRGYFIQDQPDVDPADLGSAPERFGLLDSSCDRWKVFANMMERLNSNSPSNVRYKVLFLQRHGEGIHNIAKDYYGEKAWNSYWVLLEGNGTAVWGPDAELTERGIAQAREISALWRRESFNSRGTNQLLGQRPEDMETGNGCMSVPLPQRLYSSPLTRAARTMSITYGDILINRGDIRPLIMEDLREMCGIHTTDRRRSRTYLNNRLPNFEIERDFSEEDQIWRPDARETVEEVEIRARTALGKIFAETWDTNESYIAIAAHGGTIAAALRILGHRAYTLPTGGIVPVLTKATRGGI